MDKLHEPHLIVQWINLLFGPIVASLRAAIGHPAAPGEDVIPDYAVMSTLIVVAWTVVGFLIKSRLSVESPGRTQVVIEDLVSALAGMLNEFIGPKGLQFLPLIGGLGAFILVGNYLGLVPGFMSPTSNINVAVACAITAWIYYHVQGIRAQGLIGYLKHFAGPSDVPKAMIVLILPIEIISHLARVMSLSLRLFGNIFGEELVILILGMIIPFFIPLPMMALGLITGGLQAYIFVLLTTIYLQGAVAHGHGDDHGHDHHVQEHPAADEAVPA
jgi:F-type H+-transporting ATPase subunit a